MTEYVIATESEIPEGESKILSVNGLEIGVFKSKGQYYCFRNVCPHEGGPVCRGTVTGTLVQGPETKWKLKWVREGEILYCPWHGSDFEISTGKAMTREGLRLKTYPVRVEDGQLKIEL